MSDVHILAIDLAKRSFQVCGTALGGAVHSPINAPRKERLSAPQSSSPEGGLQDTVT